MTREGIVGHARHALLILVVAAGALTIACSARGQRMNFAPLGEADRLEVERVTERGPVQTITDPARIRVAADFILPFQSGWKDPLSGPRVPELMLTFFKGTQFVGAYGVGPDYVVSHPPSQGFRSRRVPPEEVTRLLRSLGLQQARPK